MYPGFPLSTLNGDVDGLPDDAAAAALSTMLYIIAGAWCGLHPYLSGRNGWYSRVTFCATALAPAPAPAVEELEEDAEGAVDAEVEAAEGTGSTSCFDSDALMLTVALLVFFWARKTQCIAEKAKNILIT